MRPSPIDAKNGLTDARPEASGVEKRRGRRRGHVNSCGVVKAVEQQHPTDSDGILGVALNFNLLQGGELAGLYVLTVLQVCLSRRGIYGSFGYLRRRRQSRRQSSGCSRLL